MNVGSFPMIHNQCPTGYFHQLNSLQVRLGSWVEYCSAGVLHITQPLRLWTFQDGPANHRQDDVCRGPPIITVYPAIRIFNKHQFRFSILFSKLRPTQPPVGVSRSLSRRGAKTGKRSPTMLSRAVNRGSTCDSESIVNSFLDILFLKKSKLHEKENKLKRSKKQKSPSAFRVNYLQWLESNKGNVEGIYY